MMRWLSAVLVALTTLTGVQVHGNPVSLSRVIIDDGPSKGRYLFPGWRSSNVFDRPGALCLDGSPPAYYMRPPTNPPSAGTKWRIHLGGGGWSFDAKSSYERSFTQLGTSTLYPPTIPDPSVVFPWPGGFMDSNSTENPYFADWAMVYVMYCDGSSFTSLRSEPVVYNGTRLHMRGFAILDAVLDHLEDHHKLLSAATDLVLIGTSAGGLATYIHSAHVRARLNPKAFMTAYPDAGFFLDHPTVSGDPKFRSEMQAGFEMWNSSAGVNQACLAAQGGGTSSSAWKCLFAQYTFEFTPTDVPVMVLNSLYDTAQYGLILDLPCPDLSKCDAASLAVAQQYRDTFQATLEAVVVPSPSSGLFATACLQHEESCRRYDWNGIVVGGQSQRNAFTSFYTSRGTNNATLVDVRWPHNPTCAPYGTPHGGC